MAATLFGSSTILVSKGKRLLTRAEIITDIASGFYSTIK